MPTSAAGVITLTAGAGASEAYDIDRSALVLTITLQESQVTSPGVLPVTIGNGTPDGVAYVFFDDDTEPRAQIGLDSTGASRQVYLEIRQQLVGMHTVRVSADMLPPPAGSQANKVYEVTVSKDTGVLTPVLGTEPPLLDTDGRWVFQAYDFSDVEAVDTYILTLNPAQMSRSFGNVDVSHEATTVSNGRIVTWEGVPKPPVWTFAGSVLTKTDYDEMLRWGTTGQRFYVTDHFGQRYLVKCVEFSVERVRDVQRPWNHRYRMTVNVLRGTGVFTAPS